MRTEIIIPCRGESPTNLQRTVQNILRTITPDDRVHVVYDGAPVKCFLPESVQQSQPWDIPQGVGQCRHWAIMRSTAKYIVLVDAHMAFPPGWLDAIIKHLADKDHAKDITCCGMLGLEHDWTPAKGEGVYRGCYIEVMPTEHRRRFNAIACVWYPKPLKDSGVVGGLMGACYGLRRSWYAKIGAPLRILRSWGADEEVLSTCTWLMGGRIYLLPPVVTHVWAAPRPNHEWLETWTNQYALVDVLPIPEAEKAELVKFLNKSKNEKQREQCAELLARRMPVLDEVREILAAGAVRTWDSLRADGILREAVPPPPAPCVAPGAKQGQRPIRRPGPVLMIGATIQKITYVPRHPHKVVNLASDQIFRHAVQYRDTINYVPRRALK